MTCNYHETVAGHLATLRDTRAGITCAVTVSDNTEAGMSEALDRIDGDPLDREMKALGQDHEALHVDSVLMRLKSIDAPVDSAA